MKLHAALVSLAVALLVPAAQANSHQVASAAARDAQGSALHARLTIVTPPSLGSASTALTRHLFPVNDERGLLLTCVAPEIDTNKDTDVFKNCTLAPGRSLDDVMHSFIGALHEEERKFLKEQAKSEKDAAEKSGEKAEQ